MMRVIPFGRSAPWHGSRVADLQYAFSLEETLANARVVVVLLSLVVSVILQGARAWTPVTIVLLVMAVYSVAAAVAVRSRRVRFPFHAVAFQAADTAGVLLAMILTGGALSPFSTMFLFVLLAAGYRWGRRETWLTGGVGVVALVAHGVILDVTGGLVGSQHEVLPLRVSYLAIGVVLIGYMAESDLRRRHRASTVTQILSLVRAEAGLVGSVRVVLEELTRQFRASHGVLVLQEEGSDGVSLWQVEARHDDSCSRSVRLTQDRRRFNAPFLVSVPDNVDAFKVRRFSPGAGPDRASIVALDASGGRVSNTFQVPALFQTPFEWVTAFCVSRLGGEGWKGRLFLFLPVDPVAPRDQLRYLQSVVHQVSPAIFNLYLQRRLQSRAGVMDRARISRELHDGVIQSLIAVEMQLEAARLGGTGTIPVPLAAQMADMQRVLGQEILNVRDLMRLLKPTEVGPKELIGHLVETVERFRHRTGIDARFVCADDEVDLSPRTSREVAGLVHEALANVRKHSGATSVVVRLSRSAADWQLVVDDNGKGLDFEGRLSAEELEAQRRGPITIKERVRALGGRIAVQSQPGFGTRLEITIPR